MTATEPSPAQHLSARTGQTYGQDWALFTDWCAATGNQALPAGPDTVLEFLTACPAARSTQRCRVAAIDHHHTTAGVAGPGESHDVRAALGRPADAQIDALHRMPAVEAALRALPSHGWTQGMFGRRDRCLLVLSQLAGVPYTHLAHMVVSSVAVADGAAPVATAAGAKTLTATENPVLCGPCAITRWQRTLDRATTAYTTKSVAEQLKKAKEVNDQSPHLCRAVWQPAEAALAVWLFPPIDQWGALPFPVQRLTPHSLSRRVRDPLAGDYGAHRSIDVDAVDKPVPTIPAAAPQHRAAYNRADWEKAWARRRADIRRMAGIGAELALLERRADELNRRADELLGNDSLRTNRFS